jgi:hypothetical protein
MLTLMVSESGTRCQWHLQFIDPHISTRIQKPFNPFFWQEYRLFSSQNSPFPSLTTSTIDHMLSTLQYFQGPLQKKKKNFLPLPWIHTKVFLIINNTSGSWVLINSLELLSQYCFVILSSISNIVSLLWYCYLLYTLAN